MKLSHIAGIIFTSLATSSLWADTDVMKHMAISKDHIKSLEKALTEASSKTKTPIEFPAFIPTHENQKTLYANNDITSQQNGFSYMVNIDSTADCNGAKYCNVGRVSAQPHTKVDMMTDRHHKTVTIPVDLADGTKAYFTPGHAMGDYFPASIQWTDNNAVYMISWEIQSDSPELIRAILITMANSAKHPGSG